LERAAALEKENHAIIGNLARIYWLTGQTEKARQQYELAIQQAEKLVLQNPRDHAAHILLGRYYAMLGKKPDALSHINLALSLNPDDPHYLTIAAVAYVILGDRNNALGVLEQAVRLGYTAVQIRGEPELDVLTAEPRFIALVSSKP
jgi:serine/threonine-protein kinase